MTSRTGQYSTGKGLLLATIVLLNGCAANSQMEPTTSANEAFYEGKPTLAFSGLPQAPTVKAGLSMGDQALARGDADEALYHYVQVLERAPDNASAYFRIGQIHMARNNMKLASLALRSALGNEPEHIGALTALGVLQLKQNRYAEGREYLERAVANDRKRFAEDAGQDYDARSPARAYNGLGVLADLDGQTAEAQGFYQIALAIKPDAADTLNNLGYSYYLDARWGDAEKQFRKALEIAPDYEQAWRNLGLVYARQQRYLAALHAFERVMDSAQAHNDIGYICMLDGRYALAQDYFEQALTLSPVFYPKAQDNLTYVRRMQEAVAQGTGR
ncbi:MAG: tetratricopeptide repeat protein [Oceanospirillales bacterium]|uniref:Flp pilus assembly protein TadD n=1 Tax=Marinobacterium halophilum TaxID=267374 RepID=A0A2P8F1D1_9GAMM|nr:tetratricopeptide repeat protein [Marinobacterium halophilum]MBR9829223.1 tetratricopeptide repeat protein [Oceanospirillales bacterium]PSL15498.1 Flp pilus assembly protein TadD [Marinobacterium halophilum]